MGRKNSQIIQNTLIKNINEGGLRLCHYLTKVDALKLSWIKIVYSDIDANWKTLPKHFYGCNDLKLYFSANHKILNNNKNISPFYRDMHNLFMKNFKLGQSSNIIVEEHKIKIQTTFFHFVIIYILYPTFS